MRIRNKREFLAQGLGALGAWGALERLARRRVLVVLTYHRIGDPAASPGYDPIVSATPEAFRRQVRGLRDRFRLVTPDAIAEDLDVREPTALITFDDGYRDNFDVAFPILQELGAPATFFLPTGFLDRPRLPWWDHVAHVIKRTRRASLTLDWPERLALDLGHRARAIAPVIRLYLDGKIPDELRFRAHLEERADVIVDEAGLGRDLFLTWDQARRLVEAGMAVGSHSVSHPRLASLSAGDQRRELVESRRTLEERTGAVVTALAYPYGWPGAFDDQTRRLAGEAGYRLAFSAIEGVNRPGSRDRFALRRLNVGSADSPTLLRARVALRAAFGASPL